MAFSFHVSSENTHIGIYFSFLPHPDDRLRCYLHVVQGMDHSMTALIGDGEEDNSEPLFSVDHTKSNTGEGVHRLERSRSAAVMQTAGSTLSPCLIRTDKALIEFDRTQQHFFPTKLTLILTCRNPKTS